MDPLDNLDQVPGPTTAVARIIVRQARPVKREGGAVLRKIYESSGSTRRLALRLSALVQFDVSIEQAGFGYFRIGYFP
jgi:hypothetical protein